MSFASASMWKAAYYNKSGISKIDCQAIARNDKFAPVIAKFKLLLRDLSKQSTLNRLLANGGI